jgi:hypothetical protein
VFECSGSTVDGRKQASYPPSAEVAVRDKLAQMASYFASLDVADVQAAISRAVTAQREPAWARWEIEVES